MNLEQLYKALCQNPSDINEHLPTLVRYGQHCKSIAEFGTRYVVSTFAFLMAKPYSLDSYDIFYHQNIETAKNLAKENNVNFRFIQKSTLDIDLAPCDMLFIDTWHCYGQLRAELFKHGNRVHKYIIMHDTVTFGKKDEPANEGFFDPNHTLSKSKEGLMPAINEFLRENAHWQMKESFQNNNGLTVLKRNEI